MLAQAENNKVLVELTGQPSAILNGAAIGVHDLHSAHRRAQAILRPARGVERGISRPVVRPGKADAFSGDQTCRGKNQKPRSLDSKVAGDQDFEAYRQHHRKDGCESPGRSASERVRGLESDRSGPRRPSPQP